MLGRGVLVFTDNHWCVCVCVCVRVYMLVFTDNHWQNVAEVLSMGFYTVDTIGRVLLA